MRNLTTRRAERGSVATEFVLVLLFALMPLLAGLADFGQIIHVQYLLSRVAREGAMLASRGEDPTGRMREFLRNSGLDPALATLSSTGQDQPIGSEVTVRVVMDTSSMPLIPWDSISPEFTTLSTQAHARRR